MRMRLIVSVSFVFATPHPVSDHNCQVRKLARVSEDQVEIQVCDKHTREHTRTKVQHIRTNVP